ncbi:MAG: DUF2165 family protein [Pseudomonadota bacterium]
MQEFAMDALLLCVKAVLVAGPGVWMAVAVYDNWRHASLNREAVATVMRFDFMAREYPEEFAIVAHRRIDDPKRIDLAFHAIRLAETIAAVILLGASLCLLASSIGWVSPAAAIAIAVSAMTYFCMIWAGFIIGGNYFHYYFCHPWGQSNHFMFMYWGLFVLVILLL